VCTIAKFFLLNCFDPCTRAPSRVHSRTHTREHKHTHIHTHTRARARTHTRSFYPRINRQFFVYRLFDPLDATLTCPSLGRRESVIVSFRWLHVDERREMLKSQEMNNYVLLKSRIQLHLHTIF